MSDRSVPRLEALEAREVPAVLIQLDYTYDNGFFARNSEAKATLERVASELGATLSADLAAITPGGGNTWTATFYNPSTGELLSLTDLTVGANTVRVFVGARPLSGSEAGYATTAGYRASGSPGWMDAVRTRGWSGFAPWGGSIAFDSAQNWHFGQTTAGLDGNEVDFYSIASHELGHVLGIGTSQQWRNLVSGGAFRGSASMGVYGGAVPVDSDGLHWAHGTAAGESVSLDPMMEMGRRVGLSALDHAALRDLGWSGGTGSAPAASATPAGMTLFTVAGANGVFGQYAFYAGGIFPTGKQFLPFPGVGGALQQGFGDFDGDGVYDVAVATPGGIGLMAVVSGLDGRVIGAPRIAHGDVKAIVAADLDGDGRTELITREANGVFVYRVFGGEVRPYEAFSAYGEPGRAAVHVHSDVDRSGYGDSIAPAGHTAHDHTTDLSPARTDDHDHATAPVEQTSPKGRADVQRADDYVVVADETSDSGFTWERHEHLPAIWVG